MKKKTKKRSADLDVTKLKKNDEGKYILPLKKPIDWGSDGMVKQLELSEPKAKHLRQLSSDPGMDEILNIVADLAGQPDAFIDELSMGDATNACEFFGSFE
tara:strand:+ start:9846 stop:10148 length:303 start_codon:yes stop_codon:yes gene_type:complete